MKVLALVKYGALAASTRQRFVQYEPALRRHGISVDYAPLLGNDYLTGLFQGGRGSRVRVAGSYLRRLARLMTARRYDVLWIHYELFPYLPAPFERLAGWARKPIIFDFDDAVFHMYDDAKLPLARFLLKGKLAPLLRKAAACCCGNPYLQAYASRYCVNSVVVPTVVDTDVYVPRSGRREGPLVIGWIGSPSTWHNVEPILPMLRKVARERQLRLRVIGGGPAAEAAAAATGEIEAVDWREETEVEEVQNMDIGIMPLLDAPFQRGKCGYKLIQYMACGVPVVASPVGVNSDIVQEGKNGLLAEGPDQWREALLRLIDDAELRRGMGEAGRIRAVERYSLASQAPRLVEIFKSVVKPELARDERP